MYKQLLDKVRKPELWQRTQEAFWNDEHISKGMLEMHLNPDLELASRKLETIEQSVEWLSKTIQSGSKILDLGCGPGLYTKRLSALGYDVTGVDFSKRSLDYAKQHDEKSTYVYQNYLDLNYQNEFDAVTLIYCDYAALTKDERQQLLEKVHRALKPNGLFIFDVFTKVSAKNKVNESIWSSHEEGGYWSPIPHVCLEAVHLYEENVIAVNQYIIITEDEMKEYLIWNTLYTKETLTQEVIEHKFKVIELFDDVCGKAYTGRAETMCIIVSKE